ncbi:MAG: hypothetical protein ACO1PM_17680 [Acidovorax sp.]
MTSKRLQPSRTILETAEQFYRAAEHVWSAGQVEYAMPLLVNYAFSAELSLKAIDASASGAPTSVGRGVMHPPPIDSNVRIRGHRLDMMFDKLASATQADLEGRFLQHTGDELKPLLAECANYFEDVRYWYEGKVAPRFNLGGLRILARGLLHVVGELGTNPP